MCCRFSTCGRCKCNPITYFTHAWPTPWLHPGYTFEAHRSKNMLRQNIHASHSNIHTFLRIPLMVNSDSLSAMVTGLASALVSTSNGDLGRDGLHAFSSVEGRARCKIRCQDVLHLIPKSPKIPHACAFLQSCVHADSPMAA